MYSELIGNYKKYRIKSLYGNILTINSLANQMRILENNMSEISLVLGQLFVPLMEKALPVVNGLTIAIKNLLVNLAGILGIEIDPNKFGKGFTEIEDELEGQEEQIENDKKALEEYKNQLLGFDEVNKLQDVDAKATLDTEQTGGIDLTKEILEATEEYEKFWQQAYDEMDNLSVEWAKYFEQFTKPFEKIFEDIKLGDFFALGGDIGELATEVQTFVTNAISQTNWSDIGSKVGDFFEGSMLESFNTLSDAGTLITETATAIFDFLTSAVESVDWYNATGEMFNSITEFLKNLDIMEIVDSFTDFVVATQEAIIDVIDWVLDNPDKIRELFGTFVLKVMELLVAIFNSTVDITAKLIGSIIETIVENGLDEAVKSYKNGTKIGNWLKDIFEEGTKAWENGDFFEWFGNKVGEVINNGLESARQKLNELSPYFQPIVDGISETFSSLPDWFKGKFSEVGSKAKEGFSPKWQEFKQWFSGTAVAQWWRDISALFPASEWQGLFSDISSGFQTKWNEAVNWLKNTGVGKFFRTLSTQLTMEKIRDSMGSITTAVSRRWSGMLNWIKDTGVTKLWTNIKTYLSETEWVKGLVGLTDGFKKAFNNAISAVKQLWNNFADFLNGKLTWKIDPVVVMGRTLFKGTTIDLGKVPKFWTGGFPEDGLFMANHNELVGKFSNGRTAVVNNYQIEAGIEQASYRGMARALAEHSGNGGNVTVVLQGDADGLFRVVQNKANNYTQQTGQPAFII